MLFTNSIIDFTNYCFIGEMVCVHADEEGLAEFEFSHYRGRYN